MNAVEIEQAISALAEQPFDREEFPFTFLQAFVFDPARLDIEIRDRFGHPVIAREWFLVPRFVVDEAVERIRDGTITAYTYDPKTASLARTAT